MNAVTTAGAALALIAAVGAPRLGSQVHRIFGALHDLDAAITPAALVEPGSDARLMAIAGRLGTPPAPGSTAGKAAGGDEFVPVTGWTGNQQ